MAEGFVAAAENVYGAAAERASGVVTGDAAAGAEVASSAVASVQNVVALVAVVNTAAAVVAAAASSVHPLYPSEQQGNV